MKWWFSFLSLILLLVATTSAEDADYDDDAYTAQTLEPCNGGMVQVTSLQVLCDSPYTFYYGNGANRDSAKCNYGDKATISVEFDVEEDIEDAYSIYMSVGAYDGYDEQLYYGDQVDICNSVGYDCRSAGSYSFSVKTQFAYVDGKDSKFVPLLELAFGDGSSEGDFSFGGVNIKCDKNQNNGHWNSPNAGSYRTYTFLANYSILIATVAIVSVFAVVLWKQSAAEFEDARPFLQQKL